MRQLDELPESLRKAIFDEHPSPMALVLPTHRFHRCNDAYCHMLGYSRSELLAKTWQSITHPDDVDGDLSGAEALKHNPGFSRYTIDKKYISKFEDIIRVKLNVQAVWLNEEFQGYLVVAYPFERKSAPTAPLVVKPKGLMEWIKDNPRDAILVSCAAGIVLGRDVVLEIAKSLLLK